MKIKILIIILFLMSVLFYFSNNAFAGKILKWDQSETADYYIVYWGNSSGNYTEQSQKIYIPENYYNIDNFQNGDYYFTIKGFNTCGNASDFSDETFLKIETYNNSCSEIEKVTGCFIEETND